MRYEYKDGEKLTRFSIRKYHFGAASVAVASLIFFGGGMSAKAENIPVSQDSQNVGNTSNAAPNVDKDASGDSGNANKTIKVDVPVAALPAVKVEKEELSKLAIKLETLVKSTEKEKISNISKDLDKVLSDAKEVLKNEKATAEEVKTQVEELTKATKKLEETVAETDKKAEETKQIGENRSATVEAANTETSTPARSSRGRRGRTTEVQPEASTSETPKVEAATSNKETASKALPTYTNGADNYKLAEEMHNIVTYLRKNGADAAKVAAIKANYDKLNEKLGLTDEDGVLSEEDFNKALADLKQARDFTEGFLNAQPSTQPEALPVTRRSRAIGQVREGSNHYNIAKEYYYEDGTKGSSPYDKYTYLFHTFTESLVANNANHSPVRDIKRLVYEEVNEVNGGYLWTITFNAAHEDQQDGYAFFSIPKGQRVENNSINIVKTDQNGNEAEISGSGDLLNRLQNIHPNSSLRGREIGIRRNGGPEEESLEGLAKSKAYAGYYYRRLEEANGETRKSDDMFNRIADNTQSVYRFQLHGRDSYSISFKTTNTNNTRMDKLYYASGYRVQQWGRRILAEQWHGRHAYDKDDTDRFPLHVVGNGTFLIKQGKHYNTAYPQGAYGFGGRNFDYQPFKADGILGYDATGAYNSNFDMHQYTARVGSDTPSSDTKATTAGQKFEFYDKEGNKLSASQIGMHGADKPGLVEYKVKRTFADKSSDFLNIKFAIQPKTPTFTENLSKARGQVKTLTVSNGTDGYPITLFREYMENGVTKTERVKTVNAGRNGNAVFNDVLIKSGKYYAQSIIPTSAYLDYKNNKHTDVRSDKSALVTVGGDGMAPTIKVGETGKALATTPANNQVTLFVTPNNKGEVSLDVQIQDDELGDGMNAFSSAANGNAKYSITGAHNSGATTFTAKGGVTGGKTVNALLKVKLNGTTIPNGGLTVTLNAKDKTDNWTNTATPSKTLTVKLLSAVPNEPAVREITGADVQNGAIKPEVKNQVLQNVKNANPDLVNAGVKFEYDTTAGNTDKIKVTYPDGQTRLLTPMKGRKPTAPSVVGPADGTVSITPQGDTDKVTFQYVPTNETNPKTIIAKKDGNSWAIQGTRPNGITVDSRSGKITITEPTVKDLSTVTATATFLNSDTSDTARDTAKNPDREAPTVSIKTGDGTVRTLTANAADNKFLVYRGATFNPTFIVNDNSGTTDNFMIKNVPNGVWFNKQGGRDVPHTGVSNGREITFSNQVVDPITPLGTREAIVSVRDKNGNAAEYKFQYIIADVMLQNSPKSVATGSKLGDAHQFVSSTLNGTASNGDVYFPGGMKFLWANNENTETRLPNSAQTVTKEAIVEFPDTALNGRTTAAGITIYAPKQVKKNVVFNIADNEKPQATLNGVSIGQTAGAPIFTVFRGATFNPQLEAWDNSGKITNVTISGLPTNVTATPFPGGVQIGSENSKYTARLSNGVVPADQPLGEYEATLTVQGDGPKDTSVLKFKYRVADLEFKNGYETDDAGQATGKSYVIGLKNGQSVNLGNGDNNINPKDYWKVIDDANKTDRGYAYLPEGVRYSISGGAISSNPADKSKGASVAMGHYARSVSVDFTSAGEGDKVGDIANANSTSRTVFTPRTIDRRLLVAVDPSAPKIDGGEDLLYGKAGERPDIKVKEIVNIGESDADVGTVNRYAIRTIQLYSDRDPNTPIAEHAFAQGSRETEYTFRGSDYATSRPNGLLANETLYSRVKVTHRGVSTLSGNSNEKEVTAKLDVTENSTNRIIQANDQKLNDAEKTGIRIALRNANQRLNLNDEDIEISDSGEIVITKDKKRAFLQTNPNKKEGNTTTGFITRFADIRKDYKFENIEGLKVPGRDTDKGFAWSNSTSKDNVNGDRSLIYYYDATKGQSFNFNEVLNLLNLKEGWTVNHTENPSFIATQGVNKVKGEQGRDGFSQEKPSTAFLKDGNYINVIDLVEKASLGGAKNVSNSANKLVENGKAGGTGTTLQNVTIAAANGLPQFTLNNVVNGEQAIHKAQVYLRPKWVTSGTLAERNGETKDTTTNVVNLYFVPIDSTKPVVERSDSNSLGTSEDDAPRLTDTSITASSLVKVTDNYDKDDVTDSNTNSVRNKLNVWVKKDGVETQVVRNGQELTTTTGETVLGSLIKTADPATYELVGQATDTSGNISEKESLGFFKVGYNLTVRPVINLIQFEKLTDDEKRTLIQVNEGGQTDELPAGSTVQLTFDTDTDGQGKKAIATITLPNGATTTKEVTYNVDLSFPVASKVYDFAGVRRNSTDPNYYLNRGLVQGMNWYVKKETEENGQKVFKDVPPKANPNEHVMPREINKDIDPTTGGVGEYKYILGATYPKGRYTATATDELSKLRREGEIIHTVFDVKANTNEITVNSGDSLTDSQAEAAVIKTDNSPALPTGTTYEWVNQDGSPLTDKTVTGQGSVTRYVKVTLPKTVEDGPWATQVQQSKIVPVTVQLEKEAPTAKIKLGNNTPVALTENAEDNRFIIFKGADFNPTFIVNDNSGTTASINITNLPNGRTVSKTEAMPNETTVNVEGNDAATNDATLGSREANVTVTDAAGNAKTYKFKYTVVDVNLVNSPKEVSLDTKLGDSHAFAAVDKADLTVSNPDSLYPGGMIFEWKKNDQVVSNETKLSEPGRITGYKAVVRFKGGAGFYTVNGVKTFTPATIEKDVVFLVKPTAPVVTPKDNGDVEITPTNQTNVDKVSVTFTKQDDSTEVTYTAKKNSSGVWEFGSGAPLTVDPTTGVFKLKDIKVKDGSTVTAKAITTDATGGVESTPATAIAGNGDAILPTVDFKNVEIDAQGNRVVYITPTEETNLDIATITDNSNKLLEAVIFDQSTKDITLGNYGLTYNKLVRNGDTITPAPYTLNVTGTLSREKTTNTLWRDGDVIVSRYVSAMDAAENNIKEKNGSRDNVTTNPYRVIFKVKTQAAKYEPTATTLTRNDQQAKHTETQVKDAVTGTNIASKEIVGIIPNGAGVAVVKVTYNDGSTENVNVPITVTQTDATAVDPVITPVSKDDQHKPTAEDVTNAIKAPEGKEITNKVVTGTVPTEVGGPTEVAVEVTYGDGSKETVKVPVLVVGLPEMKVPVVTLGELTKEEQDKVEESVKKANPGKTVVVEPTGKVTITDPKTKVSHELPGEEVTTITPPVVEVPEYTGTIGTPGVDEEGNQIIPPVVEVPEYTGTIGSTGVDENGNLITPPVVEVPEYTGTIGTPGVDENGNLITPPVVEVPDFKDGVNGELPDPAELPKVQLIITKWTDEDGKELKAADAKAPAVLGEANEALEAGEIEGYEFVRTETKDDVVTHIFRKVTPTKPTKPADNGEEQGGDNKPQPTPTAKVEKATKRLANTGEAETNTGLAGLGLAVLGSLLAVTKRRKKDEE